MFSTLGQLRTCPVTFVILTGRGPGTVFTVLLFASAMTSVIVHNVNPRLARLKLKLVSP